MRVGKKIFSYIISAIFVFLCGLGIFGVVQTAGFARLFGWSETVLIGSICIYLLLTAAVFKALRTIFTEIGKCIRNKEKVEAVLAIVLPILIIFGVTAYIVYFLVDHMPVMLHDDTFYRMALVTAGNSAANVPYGVSGLYVRLLHVTFLIFGNTLFAGIVLQIVLLFICLVLLYIGMQAYASAIPAIVTIAAFGFFPVTMEYVFSLTPDLLYIALYLFGFYLTGVLYHKFCQSPAMSLGQYFLLIFAGLYAGFLIYLDLYSISLYFFFLVWYSADKEKNKQALKANGIALLSGAGGFLLSAMALAFENFEKSNLSENNIFEILTSYDYASLIVFVLLISLAFFIVPAVFLKGKSPDSAFILNLFLLYGLSYWGLTGTHGEVCAILCWCMLAGIGIYGTIRPSGSEREEESVEILTEKVDTIDRENTEAAEMQAQTTPKPGEPLHNPLPVPEKKRRPQADFTYPVADADMKFDIEVAENDDFDV